jgi:hypothetical protein
LHGNRIRRAVQRAGSTLHAGIAIDDSGFLVLDAEDAVRTDDRAHTATKAFHLIQFQRNNTGQIAEFAHGTFFRAALIY